MAALNPTRNRPQVNDDIDTVTEFDWLDAELLAEQSFGSQVAAFQGLVLAAQ